MYAHLHTKQPDPCIWTPQHNAKLPSHLKRTFGSGHAYRIAALGVYHITLMAWTGLIWKFLLENQRQETRCLKLWKACDLWNLLRLKESQGSYRFSFPEMPKRFYDFRQVIQLQCHKYQSWDILSKLLLWSTSESCKDWYIRSTQRAFEILWWKTSKTSNFTYRRHFKPEIQPPSDTWLSLCLYPTLWRVEWLFKPGNKRTFLPASFCFLMIFYRL